MKDAGQFQLRLYYLLVDSASTNRRPNLLLYPDIFSSKYNPEYLT